jgi:hypothetical protein
MRLFLQPHPPGSTAVPFAEMLPELVGRSIVLCGESGVADYASFGESYGFPDFELNDCVVRRALEIGKQRPLTSVIALEEGDLVRAGKLRDRLGLPGQSADSAFAFRNKVRMKELIQRAGLPLPAFRSLVDAFALLDFVSLHGLPVVVKPVDSAGSRGVRMLRSDDDLDAFLAKGIPTGYMVEQLVPGKMCHVDGFWRDGALWCVGASRYLEDGLAHTRGGHFGSIQLDPTDPLAGRLFDFTRQVLTALPSPPATAFHFEVFLRNDDPTDLVFCEIASRVGGGLISQVFKRTYGISLARLFLRSQAMLELDEVERRSGRLHGFVLIAPKSGVLDRIPERCTLPSVVSYRATTIAGSIHNGAQSLIDCVAKVIVAGRTSNEVRGALDEVLAWYEAEACWSARTDPA